MLTTEIHKEAIEAARKAANNYYDTHGAYPYNCGFSSVVASVKGNTKLGKSFIKQGFEKYYGGGYYLWNPSDHMTQDLSVKAAGSTAYIEVINKYLPDIKLYSNNRLD